MLLREDADAMQLKDIDFPEPAGPLAARLKWHLAEICRKASKIGKRKLGEFRQATDDGAEFCLFMLIADKGGFLLRAKLRDPSYYVVVPVLEDAASDAPWNRKAFGRVCATIQGPSV